MVAEAVAARLRVLGVLAVGAVAMPHSWLDWSVDRIEPGLRVYVVVPYLARLLSAFYVLLGVLLLVFARDVRRYHRPIQLTAIWTCLSVAALLVHVTACSFMLRHWFTWCVLMDGAYGLAVAVAVLILQRRVPRAVAEPDVCRAARIGRPG